MNVTAIKQELQRRGAASCHVCHTVPTQRVVQTSAPDRDCTTAARPRVNDSSKQVYKQRLIKCFHVLCEIDTKTGCTTTSASRATDNPFLSGHNPGQPQFSNSY